MLPLIEKMMAFDSAENQEKRKRICFCAIKRSSQNISFML